MRRTYIGDPKPAIIPCTQSQSVNILYFSWMENWLGAEPDQQGEKAQRYVGPGREAESSRCTQPTDRPRILPSPLCNVFLQDVHCLMVRWQADAMVHSGNVQGVGLPGKSLPMSSARACPITECEGLTTDRCQPRSDEANHHVSLLPYFDSLSSAVGLKKYLSNTLAPAPVATCEGAETASSGPPVCSLNSILYCPSTQYT